VVFRVHHQQFDRFHTREPAEKPCAGLSRGMSAEQTNSQ
jgi:hypothetical protein